MRKNAAPELSRRADGNRQNSQTQTAELGKNLSVAGLENKRRGDGLFGTRIRMDRSGPTASCRMRPNAKIVYKSLFRRTAFANAGGLCPAGTGGRQPHRAVVETGALAGGSALLGGVAVRNATVTQNMSCALPI